MKDNTVSKGGFMKGEYCALLGSWRSLESWVLLVGIGALQMRQFASLGT